MKARRGPETDRNDCRFPAKLLRHGMIRAGFIAPRAVGDLRNLTRRRRQLIGDANSERNRVQKVLEEANIKLLQRTVGRARRLRATDALKAAGGGIGPESHSQSRPA
jgi:hypothetical protein